MPSFSPSRLGSKAYQFTMKVKVLADFMNFGNTPCGSQSDTASPPTHTKLESLLFRKSQFARDRSNLLAREANLGTM